jgi:hypothetical protein
MTANELPAESPAEPIRNALALLMTGGEPLVGPDGKRICFSADTIEWVKRDLWKAVRLIEP